MRQFLKYVHIYFSWAVVTGGHTGLMHRGAGMPYVAESHVTGIVKEKVVRNMDVNDVPRISW